MRLFSWHTRSPFGSRGGFTILELLVSISILSLLMALLLPAVQESRATARRMQCLNNLRQLALAVSSFEGNYGYLPGGCGSPRPFDSQTSPGALSAQVMLLPYLEQTSVYQTIDMEETGLDWYPYPKNVGKNGVAIPSIAIFNCPDDAIVSAGTSYRFCVGTGKFLNDGGAMSCICGMSEQGLRRIYRPGFSKIVDGLSNTALASETLQGDGDDSFFSNRRDSLRLLNPWPMATAFFMADSNAAAAICQSLSSEESAPHVSNAGNTWALSGNAYTWYSHILPPNSSISDCTASGFTMSLGVVTARSLHRGGVNVAMADSSVRFTNNSIAVDVWRKIGGRDDGN